MRSDWRDDALCVGSTHLFFPDEEGRTTGMNNGAHNDRAIAICMQCPVMAECGEYAIKNSDSSSQGVWGGMHQKRLRAAVRYYKRHGIIVLPTKKESK